MIIFSSNQVFSFSGDRDDKESIKILAELIVKAIRPYGWRYEDGNLFFNCFRDEKDNAINHEDMNEEYITSVLSLYFASNVYRETLKENCALQNGDGSYEKGWLATYECYNHDLEGMLIKPYWCFYHK